MKLAAKVTSKGQITIPLSVRGALGIKKGDMVIFEKCETGKYMLSGPEEINDPLDGMFAYIGQRMKRPATLKQMKDAIAKGANRGRFTKRK